MGDQRTFTNNDFAFMLNHYKYNINLGDIVAGTIFHQENQGFLVDIGEHKAGYLPIDETSLMHMDLKYTIHCLTNETREFFILAYNRKSKQLILSIKRLEYIRAWKRIKQLEAEDIVLELTAKKFNKGGIITSLEGLQSFIPNSHLLQPNNKLSIKKRKIKCKLLFADEKTNKLILSHKKAILDISRHKFTIGDTVIGQIIDIKSYGVFIKVYNIPALLHISEIGQKSIKDIHSIFYIGQKIKVKILHIDLEQGRLSLSRKDLN